MSNNILKKDSIIEIGDITIRKNENIIIIPKDYTNSKVKASGKATVYKVTHENGDSIELQDIIWNNGERTIRAKESKGTIALKRLEHGLRLGIHSNLIIDNMLWCLLRQARILPDEPEDRSQVFKATKEELDTGAGVDVFSVLYNYGAEDIDTKYNLLRKNGSTRNCQCVVFPISAEILPVIAYVLTRVLPLINGIKANE